MKYQSIKRFFSLEIGTPRKRLSGDDTYQDVIFREGENFRTNRKLLHQAGFVFVHEPGTEFKGKLTKARRYNELVNKVKSLDDLEKLLIFKNFPRKIKKQLKKAAQRKIQSYKENY
jgi:hypothetical protein